MKTRQSAAVADAKAAFGGNKIPNKTVLVRPSTTTDGELRILRDLGVEVGATAGPMTFKNRTEAEKHIADNNLGSEGFVPMTLAHPRKSGNAKKNGKKAK